jgi:hypothetical protein
MHNEGYDSYNSQHTHAVQGEVHDRQFARSTIRCRHAADLALRFSRVDATIGPGPTLASTYKRRAHQLHVYEE